MNQPALLKIQRDLNHLPVMLSASVPDELAGTPRAQDLITAVMLLTHQVISANGRLIFGGHPSITPLVRRAALKLGKKGGVSLFQLTRFRDQAPKDIWDANAFDKIDWIGDGAGAMDDELAQMRDEMAKASKAAVFIGGKTNGSLTQTRGVRDEYERFLKKNPEGPVYLSGLMNGETLNLINEMESKNEREKNGLSDDELKEVRHSKDIDLVVSLILDDLAQAAL